MSLQRQTFPQAGRRPSCRGSLGPELLGGLLVLALALWLMVEMVGRVQQWRRCHAFLADLRDFSAAYQRLGKQDLAVTGGDRAAPRAWEELTKETNWSKGSPFGGDYQWHEETAGDRKSATVIVTAFAPHFPLSVSRAELLAIDAEIDDGNLATGRFRTGFNGWPVYRLDHQR
ncbi:MAG TPA: hypothetical protein VM029_12715 [Opitutaceae bacterium]|nr:hypothetical protein [Opitutaceae bacterium]